MLELYLLLLIETEFSGLNNQFAILVRMRRLGPALIQIQLFFGLLKKSKSKYILTGFENQFNNNKKDNPVFAVAY